MSNPLPVLSSAEPPETDILTLTVFKRQADPSRHHSYPLRQGYVPRNAFRFVYVKLENGHCLCFGREPLKWNTVLTRNTIIYN